jgi:hypothetical protein
VDAIESEDISYFLTLYKMPMQWKNKYYGVTNCLLLAVGCCGALTGGGH